MGFKKGIHKCVECERKIKEDPNDRGMCSNAVQQKLVLKEQCTKN